MAKYLLEKSVITVSRWEVNAESVSDAIKAIEQKKAKQTGFDKTETIFQVGSEAVNEDRALVERKQFGDV